MMVAHATARGTGLARALKPLRRGADHERVLIDLLMGLTAMLIGATLLARSAPIADLMKEGDDQWRAHPVFSRFEPSSGVLTTDEGRWWALRCWLVVWSTGFVVVGGALLVRGLAALL